MSRSVQASKIVNIFSGGLDSTVLLYENISSFGIDNVYPLIFDYNQRHSQELQSARHMIRLLGLTDNTVMHRLDLSIFENSALTNKSKKLPENSAEITDLTPNVVPARNLIFLSIAAGYAHSIGAPLIYFATHTSERVRLYPDCRPVFVESMNRVVQDALEGVGEYSKQPPFIQAPFASMYKWEIVKIGASLGVDFNMTWSCYDGDESVHCGKCSSCIDRKDAFRKAEVNDPTTYRQ